MNREEKEKDDFEWNKWCEKREMDEAVHENVIINYINDITVYKNIITYLINDSPNQLDMKNKNGARN